MMFVEYWPKEPWKTAAFADPMRAISMVFGFTDNQMNDPREKELPDSFWGISWRKFATMVGTDLFRKRWRWDVWVRLAERRMVDHPEYRYDNAATLPDQLGLVVISRKLVDFTVVNDSTLEHFHSAVCDMVDDELFFAVKHKEGKGREFKTG